MDKKIYPRLHVILARESDKAVIIRRGPSKFTAVIGWDRGSDNFYLGQWLKGKIFHHRSDISPDGKYWIYFVLHKKYGQKWTAVAEVPYLKAIDFYTKEDTFNGGGIFLKNDTYWLNDGNYSKHILQRKGNLTVEKNRKLNKSVDGEDVGIYFFKLARYGWKKRYIVKVNSHCYKYYFHKKINKEQILCKIFYSTLNHPIGKSCYFERHEIIDIKNKKKWEFPDWEWADFDNGRLVWAEYGKIMQGSMDEYGIKDVKELYDTNPLAFEELVAPY